MDIYGGVYFVFFPKIPPISQSSPLSRGVQAVFMPPNTSQMKIHSKAFCALLSYLRLLRDRTNTHFICHRKYIIYVENGMYQPHLARKFKLRRFRMEIDRKNCAVLMSMVLEQIGNYIITKKRHFQKSFFSKKFSCEFI